MSDTTRLRFLGAEPVEVGPLGGRTVEPDEVVDVPNELIYDNVRGSGYVWPEELWAEVGSGRRRSVPVADDPPPVDDGRQDTPVTDDDTATSAKTKGA